MPCSLFVLLLAVALWMAFIQPTVGLHLELQPSGVKCPSNCEALFLKLQDGVQEVRMNLQAGKRVLLLVVK